MNSLRKLGVSIYPAHQDVEEMKGYLLKASQKGFSRIFASMLELTNETKEKVISKFTETFKYAKELGFDVCLDVNPRIFNILNVDPNNLKVFNGMNVTTVRLDMPFDSKTEAAMTFNKYGINIEVNISNGTEYIANILSYKPLKDKLIGCHNFYPQKGAGLEEQFFYEATILAKKHGIRTAAFISSQTGNQGPWSVSDGLPTLEIHRNLNISTQAKHLWATDLIDDIIIGNAFASEKELDDLAKINRYKTNLSVKLMPKTSDVEKEIILLKDHFRRGDINKSTIRSTMSRVNYKKHNFSIHDNNLSQEKGNVYIGNDSFGIYKGELQLVISDMPTDERKNLVARVIKSELFLLNFIKSWSKFEFILEKDHD